MTQLANRALLVSLNISQWAARKLDRRESAEVEARNGATAGAARVNKSLLPMAQSLDHIHKLTGTIRTDYYKNTLPWIDGMGIIKTEGYIAFTRMMGDHKIKWENAVREFIDDYPSLRDDARLLLGSLYKDEDYPEPETVAAKFRMDVSFYPVPSADDWRVDIADSQMDALREQVTAKVMESQGKAMREAWQRLYDVVSKAHERLCIPDNIFRDSLIENARELCTILPTLNIADDPQLEDMRRKLEGSLCQYDPDDLRKDTTLRMSASDQLREIMSKMGGMYQIAA